MRIDLTLWTGVFLGMVILDFAWARYIISVAHGTTNKHYARSGLYAAVLIVLAGFVQISYVADHSLLIPAALGAFVGTIGGSK